MSCFMSFCGWMQCPYLIFFFFKQKTAYEMRISDWSSDVCSSDLEADRLFGHHVPILALAGLGERDHADAGNTGSGHNITPWPSASQRTGDDQLHDFVGPAVAPRHAREIGSASCRERVCPYV